MALWCSVGEIKAVVIRLVVKVGDWGLVDGAETLGGRWDGVLMASVGIKAGDTLHYGIELRWGKRNMVIQTVAGFIFVRPNGSSEI
jgi:hypothetical protein